MTRVSTGVPKLDRVIGGGLPVNTVILLSGGPGTGKTLFGLNFLLDGAVKGEKCCYVSLNEDKEELVRACQGIEKLKDVKKYLGKNLAIEGITLGEHITMKKFIEIIASYPKIDRLVIDDVNKLLMFAENSRSYRIQLSELVRHLNEMGCTLLICETGEGKIDTGNGEAFEADGVISLSFLEVEERPSRILQVHKLRYTSFEPKIAYKLNITSKIISLSETKLI